MMLLMEWTLRLVSGNLEQHMYHQHSLDWRKLLFEMALALLSANYL